MDHRSFSTGNSVVLYLPREILDDLGLTEGKRYLWSWIVSIGE